MEEIVTGILGIVCIIIIADLAYLVSVGVHDGIDIVFHAEPFEPLSVGFHANPPISRNGWLQSLSSALPAGLRLALQGHDHQPAGI